MSKSCPFRQYYDVVVERCQGCSSICYGSFLRDANSDCSRFCPDMMKSLKSPDDIPNMSAGTVNITEIALITCAVLVLVSLIGVFIWRRFGSRRQSAQDPESLRSLSAPIQATDNEHEHGTSPVQPEELAMSELYIGNFPNDHLLSSSEV